VLGHCEIAVVEWSWELRKIAYVKGKEIPLQAWTFPEASRRLRLHISRQSAREGGKVVRTGCRIPNFILFWGAEWLKWVGYITGLDNTIENLVRV
jgi:hypothetical protein